MEEAIKNRDFTSFTKLTCSDSNQFHAVCMDTSPPIFYMNDTSHRYLFLLFCFIWQSFAAFSYQWCGIDRNPLTNDARIISLVEKWNRSAGTPEVCMLAYSIAQKQVLNFI